jgi:hypothetical protein
LSQLGIGDCSIMLTVHVTFLGRGLILIFPILNYLITLKYLIILNQPDKFT